MIGEERYETIITEFNQETVFVAVGLGMGFNSASEVCWLKGLGAEHSFWLSNQG